MVTGGGRTRTWVDRLPPDIFGSDVFVQYSRTYVWQANQVAHFALGFGWGSLCSWGVRLFHGGPGEACWFHALCALGILSYLAKEAVDVHIAVRQATGFYELDRSELLWDTTADVWFVTSGVLTALFAHHDPAGGSIMAAVAVASFFALRRYFLPAKRSLDRAALPYAVRLCMFPNTEGVKACNLRRIRAFVANEPVGGFEASPAVLIQGYRGTGKTALAAGIGTEFALRKQRDGRYGRTLYVTAFSLFEATAPNRGASPTGEPWPLHRRELQFLGAGDPWHPDCAEMLIIDNVDSDDCVYGGESPAEILDNIRRRPELRRLLRCRKTVWVTGTSEFAKRGAAHGWKAWHDALAAFYGLPIAADEVGDSASGGKPRASLPVIWLRQPIR